ncbi:hypothetical protein Z583_03378, partial [Mycobacterium tuberculosis variant bovis Bz 31150]
MNTRLISGRAQEVLTRLADASYDLVFIDADPIDQPDYVAEGVRLLRSGGVIVVANRALLQDMLAEYSRLPDGQVKTDRLADIAA